MTCDAIINKIIKTLHTFSVNKIEDVADFVDYISKKHEDHVLQRGIEKMVEQSDGF